MEKFKVKSSKCKSQFEGWKSPDGFVVRRSARGFTKDAGSVFSATLHFALFILPFAFFFLSLPCYAASELFQRLSVEAEGGYAFPQGNLEPVLDPSPDLGLRITSSYHGPFLAHVRLHGGRLDGGQSPVPVLFAAGGVGLEWRGTRAYLPALGLGVSLNYGRVSGDDVPAGGSFFMEDGESEFGFYPFLRWHIPVRRAFFLVGEIRNDVILTEPAYSRMISTLIGAGWQWK